jgi:hypothetical protein
MIKRFITDLDFLSESGFEGFKDLQDDGKI